MAVPPIITVRSRDLSLWQSAVAATIRKEAVRANAQLSVPGLSRALRDHPAMRAATVHVLADHAGEPLNSPNLRSERFQADSVQVTLSKLYYEYAQAKVAGHSEQAAALDTEIRKYSTADWAGWMTCAVQWEAYYGAGANPLYRDWKDPHYGNSNINYSVIDYRLPNDAKVAIIGDWGTGMPDAVTLVTAIMQQDPAPAAIIHLGDIYYSGTYDECMTTFYNVFQCVFNNVGKRVPVFTIPGNHDYYAGGTGFYPLLDMIATAQPGCQQPASYFCLRTQDNMWQFLAMDTGYNDHNPLIQFSGPAVQANEVAWHQDKLSTFSGSTILLSHHQLFSANNTINTPFWQRSYLNEYLYQAFQPYFNKIAAWFWGHEHNLVLYQNDLLGLAKARLIGCSAYEETEAENPYQVNYPEIPYLQPLVQVSATGGYYNHGYAIIDLARSDPSNPVNVTYYEFPSWGDTAPSNPLPGQLGNPEMLHVPSHYITGKWQASLPGSGYDIVSVLASDQYVYAGSHGNVYALDSTTGSVVGHNSLSGMDYDEVRLAMAGNALIVGTHGYALALNTANLENKPIWETSLPGCGYNIVSVLANGGAVYAGSNGHVYKLDPSSGNVQHDNSLSGCGNDEVRLAISGDSNTLLVGTNGYVVALDTSDLDDNRSPKWQTSLPGSGYNIVDVLADSAGFVYAGSQGNVYKLDPTNGAILEHNELSGMGYGEVRLALLDNMLVVGTHGYALALDTANLGSDPKWSASLPGCLYAVVSLLVNSGQIFAASNGYLYELVPVDGTLLYFNSLSGMGYHEIRLARAGSLLCAGINGYVLGLDAYGQ
jgi:hypothetical protein